MGEIILTLVRSNSALIGTTIQYRTIIKLQKVHHIYIQLPRSLKKTFNLITNNKLYLQIILILSKFQMNLVNLYLCC